MAKKTSAGKKAALTRKRRATARKAATTRKRKRTAKKAVHTKKQNRLIELAQAATAAIDAGDMEAAKRSIAEVHNAVKSL
jgi:hypothetical protein